MATKKKAAKPAKKNTPVKKAAPAKKPAAKSASHSKPKVAPKKAAKPIAKKSTEKLPAKKSIKPASKHVAHTAVAKTVHAKPAHSTKAPIKKTEVKHPVMPKKEEKKPEAKKIEAKKPDLISIPPPKKPAPPAKPVKVVIPEMKTKTVRKYEPEFTKSVLDQPDAPIQGPTMRYSDSELQEFRELIQKKLTRLTSGEYSYDQVNLSPNGKYFTAVYSNISTAPVMVLIDNKGKVVREIVNTKTAEAQAYAIPVSKILTVKSSDGIFNLPMSITYPVNFDSTKKYPVWISIYGGPDHGTLFDRWKPVGGLTQWWAQEGIIQVVMDNRSSGHFGKKGMNYVFKKLGIWEIEDYLSCAKWLKAQPWVDGTKIGITGGSYGGYVTCMALTYGSDVFTHGIANYSVTDWQLYDSHYTERFMKTPEQNPDGYKNTSVMTYTQKYKGGLRIVHGSTDDNVHMQHSIQLIDVLQDMNKSFEFMIYPNQRHGIGNTKARHNLTETCRFIYKYMLGKELPAEFTN